MITTVETALVIDDDALMREFIVESLRRNGITVTETSNGLDAKRMLEERQFDMAFIDLKMPGMDGMQILKFIKASRINTLPVIITAFGTVEKAVEAMRNGAYDFLMKPFSPEQVEIIINRAKEWAGLQAQNTYLKEELGWILPHGRQIVGQSPLICKLMKDVKQVAASNSTVLITGESGTGKELVALAIHSLSERSSQPFIRMNCAAVPDALMDSELFGHEKGAFTSAITRRIGRFELANHGTLLLDEISEMNVGVQAKLLRVLQEHEFERVGGSATIHTDCRLIATTNRNLKEQVEKGAFRQDLFYRLNVVPVNVPSLRERPEDIPLLVKAFIQRFSQNRGKNAPVISLTESAMIALQRYSWPGNVRELENLIERLCVMEQGSEVGIDKLPMEGGGTLVTPSAAATPVAENDAQEDVIFSIPDIEHRTILRALRATNGNRRRSAELLGISIRTLRNKLNLYRATSRLPEDL
jgi:two-component system response regulator AtoC